MLKIPTSLLVATDANFNSVKRDYKHVEVKPYASALGAEVLGVDLANLSQEEIQEIKWALADHSVVFFRDQDWGVEDQERFTQNFGEFGFDPFVDGIEGHPNVLRLLKEANEKTGVVFGAVWHSDWTFQEQPPSFTILSGKDVPPYGGDTLFASLYNAYDSLSPSMQKLCESLNVIHSASASYGQQNKELIGSVIENMDVKTGGEHAQKMVTHPMVTVHPVTGRKVLYISGTYTVGIEGMYEDEFRHFISFLQEKVVQDPLNMVRFRWRPGSVAMWDNRCTQHYPMSDYKGLRREMYRTIVAGGRPVGVDGQSGSHYGVDEAA